MIKTSSTHFQGRKSNSLRNYKKQIFLKAGIILICAITILLLRIVIVQGSDAEVPENNSYRYYTSVILQQNDTLWDIADKYNIGNENKAEYINSIMKLNNMDSDTIYAGNNLLVYYYSTELK